MRIERANAESLGRKAESAPRLLRAASPVSCWAAWAWPQVVDTQVYVSSNAGPGTPCCSNSLVCIFHNGSWQSFHKLHRSVGPGMNRCAAFAAQPRRGPLPHLRLARAGARGKSHADHHSLERLRPQSDCAAARKIDCTDIRKRPPWRQCGLRATGQNQALHRAMASRPYLSSLESA